MKIALLLLASILFFIPSLFAMSTQEAVPISEAASTPAAQENEYYDATVLLIDYDNGMLGVKLVDEKTNEETKLSFVIDPEEVNVATVQNQYLEFSDIQVGDHLDIYTEIGKDGKETVLDIIDYSQIPKE